MSKRNFKCSENCCFMRETRPTPKYYFHLFINTIMQKGGGAYFKQEQYFSTTICYPPIQCIQSSSSLLQNTTDIKVTKQEELQSCVHAFFFFFAQPSVGRQLIHKEALPSASLTLPIFCRYPLYVLNRQYLSTS